MESSVSPELVLYQNNLLTQEFLTSQLVLCLPLQMVSGDNTGCKRVNVVWVWGQGWGKERQKLDQQGQ